MQTMQNRETEQVCLQVKTPAEFLREHWLQFEDISEPSTAFSNVQLESNGVSVESKQAIEMLMKGREDV